MTTAPQMTFSDYAAIDAANWTRLNRLRKQSPKHYRYAPTTDDTTGRMLGRATHALVFEPDVFYASHAIYDGEGNRASREYKEFVAANPGKDIIKRAEFEETLAQVDAIRSSPVLAPYLTDGLFEQTIVWTDPDTGLRCKARLDWIHLPTKTILDLKGAASVHPTAFGTFAAKQGYHIQIGGHYYNAVRYGLGWEPEEVGIVAVEFAEPYDVALYTLNEDDLALAQDEISELYRRVIECQERDFWPGHGVDEFDPFTPAKRRIALPRWAWGYDDEDAAVDELEEMGFSSGDAE